jgi:hypothetical protein
MNLFVLIYQNREQGEMLAKKRQQLRVSEHNLQRHSDLDDVVGNEGGGGGGEGRSTTSTLFSIMDWRSSSTLGMFRGANGTTNGTAAAATAAAAAAAAANSGSSSPVDNKINRGAGGGTSASGSSSIYLGPGSVRGATARTPLMQHVIDGEDEDEEGRGDRS